MKKTILGALLVLLVTALSAGAGEVLGDGESEIYLPIIAKGNFVSPTVTPTPTEYLPTPEPTPTNTPTPTVTPTVTPTNTPPSTGPVVIPPGFDPDPGLVNVGGVRSPADQLQQEFPYGIAGWRYCKNDWCDTPNFRCSLQLPAWHWLVLTAEEIRVPGVGVIRDPNGGAALLLMVDRPDQTFRWDHETSVLVQAGYMATGRVWIMADETHTHEVEAILRDFYLYETGWNMEFVGQCGSSDLCGTITWATVQRWFDGSWHLTGAGQWVRN